MEQWGEEPAKGRSPASVNEATRMRVNEELHRQLGLCSAGGLWEVVEDTPLRCPTRVLRDSHLSAAGLPPECCGTRSVDAPAALGKGHREGVNSLALLMFPPRGDCGCLDDMEGLRRWSRMATSRDTHTHYTSQFSRETACFAFPLVVREMFHIDNNQPFKKSRDKTP